METPQFLETERIGPHYLKEPIVVSENFKIHLTPEGCKFYLKQYKKLLTHKHNAEHHDYIRLLIRRTEEALEYYKSNFNI